MKLSDVQKRLQAPFPASVVSWKPGVISKDRKRALMLAHIDGRAVMDRLDAITPDGWEFHVEPITAAKLPTVMGRLTILGVTRMDIGEAPEGDLGTYKAAASDALKRCAVHFGIGRYLYDLPKQWADWDDSKRAPTSTPELPDWARPDHERSPGGAHLVQAMEQLRYQLPEDLDLQREVYKHLKAALTSLNPRADYDRPAGPAPAPQAPAEPDPAAEPQAPAAPQEALAGADDNARPVEKKLKGLVVGHLTGARYGLTDRAERIAFLADLTGIPELQSSGDMTQAMGRWVLGELESPRGLQLLTEWRARRG